MEAYRLERRIGHWLKFLKENGLNVSDFELMKLAIELVRLESQ